MLIRKPGPVKSQSFRHEKGRVDRSSGSKLGSPTPVTWTFSDTSQAASSCSSSSPPPARVTALGSARSGCRWPGTSGGGMVRRRESWNIGNVPCSFLWRIVKGVSCPVASHVGSFGGSEVACFFFSVVAIIFLFKRSSGLRGPCFIQQASKPHLETFVFLDAAALSPPTFVLLSYFGKLESFHLA